MRDRVRAGLGALVLSLSLAAAVDAGPFEDGVAAYKRGDYAAALRFWRPLAEQGDAAAQFNLGLTYGLAQDYAEAVKWYRKAAEQGYAQAQHNLGAIYDNGSGVPQNYAEAVKWYRRAADQGHASAQKELGNMYAYGLGVPQDYVQAHKWYNLAAAHDPGTGAAVNRALVAHKMSPVQIAEAQRLAREWKAK